MSEISYDSLIELVETFSDNPSYDVDFWRLGDEIESLIKDIEAEGLKKVLPSTREYTPASAEKAFGRNSLFGRTNLRNADAYFKRMCRGELHLYKEYAAAMIYGSILSTYDPIGDPIPPRERRLEPDHISNGDVHNLSMRERRLRECGTIEDNGLQNIYQEASHTTDALKKTHKKFQDFINEVYLYETTCAHLIASSLEWDESNDDHVDHRFLDIRQVQINALTDKINERVVAVLLGQNTRLGQDSPLMQVDQDLMEVIARMAHTKPRDVMCLCDGGATD